LAALPVGDVGRLHQRLDDQATVSTTRWRFRLLSFLPSSSSWLPGGPLSVVLMDWLSLMAAFGGGSRPARRRLCSRRTACIRAQSPLRRQLRQER
jgi:hypothetical protein